MKPNHKNGFALLAVIAASVSPLAAATGGLDKTFHSDGKVTASFGGSETANGIAVMSNGKIVVAGVANNDVVVLRYNSNGTLDTSFSSDGAVTTDIGSSSADSVGGVAVQPDGKIVVVGASNLDAFIARYNADGSLDTFFSGTGKRVLNFAATDKFNAVKILPDGKILAVGSNYISSAANMVVARFNADGSFDTSFSTNGWQEIAFGAEDIAKAVAVQADGKIVVAGYSDYDGTNDFALARVNADGSPDATFNPGSAYVGTFLYDFDDDDRANAVAIQKDGKIVAAGSWDGGSADFALIRVTPAGALDTSFSDDGAANASFASAGFGVTELCTSVLIQPDGKFVLSGTTLQNGSLDFGVMRFNTNGTLDTTFSGDGKSITDFNAGSADYGVAAALQSNGKLLVAGSSNADVAIARFDMIDKADLLVGTSPTGKRGDNLINTTGSGQSINVKVANGEKKTGYAIVQNDGHSASKFKIKGTGGNKFFTVKYLKGKKDVTDQVKAGTFSTPNLAVGAKFALTVEVTGKKDKKGKKRDLFVTGTPSAGGGADTVLFKATLK